MTIPTLYKVLVNGRSCHGGNMEWSLPTQAPDGSWVPGAWHEVDGPLSPCSRGLHVTAMPRAWFVADRARECQLWRCETGGEVIAHKADKHVARSVRLVAPASWADHGVYVVADGEHNASGDSWWHASGSATVRASDSATVEAFDSATVDAFDSATVEASGSATVRASGSATVRASGSATVEAFDSATVEAFGSATVEAFDSATVQTHRAYYGENRATVTLHGALAVHVDRRGGVAVVSVGSAGVA